MRCLILMRCLIPLCLFLGACDLDDNGPCAMTTGRISTPAVSPSSVAVSGVLNAECAIERVEVAGILATPRTSNFGTWEAIVPAARVEALRQADGRTVLLAATAFAIGGGTGVEFDTVDVLVPPSALQPVGGLTLALVPRTVCSVPVGQTGQLSVTAVDPEAAGARVQVVGVATEDQTVILTPLDGTAAGLLTFAAGDAERLLTIQAQGFDAVSAVLPVQVSGPPRWTGPTTARRDEARRLSVRTTDRLMRCAATLRDATLMLAGEAIDSNQTVELAESGDCAGPREAEAQVTFDVAAGADAFVEIECEDTHGRRASTRISLDPSAPQPAPGLTLERVDADCPLPADGQAFAEVRVVAEPAAAGAYAQLSTTLGAFDGTDAMNRVELMGGDTEAVASAFLRATQAGTALVRATASGAVAQTKAIRFVGPPSVEPGAVMLAPARRVGLLFSAPTPILSCSAYGASADRIAAVLRDEQPVNLTDGPAIREPGDCATRDVVLVEVSASEISEDGDLLEVRCADAWGRVAIATVRVEGRAD